MATLLEAIEMKIKRLQEQAEAIKAKQASATLDRIQDLMLKHGITVADIDAHVGKKNRGASRGTKTATLDTPTAKYQDPKTGATWSGRGRAPAWIAKVKDRTQFLVDANASTSASVATSKAKTVGNYVRGPQPPKYRDPKTGATWSGRGPAPAWLAAAKDRSKFLIAADAIAAESSAVSNASKPRPGRKGGAVGKKAVARSAAPSRRTVTTKPAAPTARKHANKVSGRKSAAAKAVVNADVAPAQDSAGVSAGA